MGGRGTFAAGNPVPYSYETVGKIGGVKVIKGINSDKLIENFEEISYNMT